YSTEAAAFDGSTLMPQTGSLSSFLVEAVAAGASARPPCPGDKYFAGDDTNLCMHPGEQKQYVVPSCSALPRGCSGSTAMPHTGSFTETSTIRFSLLSEASLISRL